VQHYIAISAAVVAPVGRNAYWSAKSSETGGETMAGYRKLLAIMRSSILLRTGVIDMGLIAL